MRTKDEILAILKKELPNLNNLYHVRRIALFGSYSRNEQTEKSDVDLLVEFERPVGLFTLIELEEVLGQLIGLKIDLGTPDSLKAPIRSNILKEAVYA